MVRNPEITHKIMSSIKSKNTGPEIMLRKALWHKNMRYRVNYKELPGSPDIVFTKYKVVVFCDGDFWHGHNWALRGISSLEEELKGYSEYWQKKILRNVERDKQNDKTLQALGWVVVRIWESEIKKDVDSCVLTIQEALFEAKMQQFEYEFDDDLS